MGVAYEKRVWVGNGQGWDRTTDLVINSHAKHGAATHPLHFSRRLFFGGMNAGREGERTEPKGYLKG